MTNIAKYINISFSPYVAIKIFYAATKGVGLFPNWLLPTSDIGPSIFALIAW